MPETLAELDLWESRSRRRSEGRRAAALARLRGRRRVRRTVVVSFAAVAVALAVVAGPRGAADTIRQLGLPVHDAPACPVPTSLRPAFVDAAREAHVSLSLLTAVAEVESKFDQNARSNAGAIGVLQLMPATAASLHYDPQEVRANVMAGALYLRRMLNRYRSVGLALSAYNAGPTAVDRVAGPPTDETLLYVARVEQRWSAVKGCS